MYVSTAIRFRDPFVSSKDCPTSLHGYNQARDDWTTDPRSQDLNRSLTPPPEMSGVHSSTRPSFHAGEYGQQHSQAYRAAYQHPEASNDSKRNGVIPAYHNGRVSPAKQGHVEHPIDSSQSRRGSQYHNAIATNFQIPRSVNDSGGSLSELAAQITCLFWFESSDLLQQVEDSPILLPNSRPLAADAKPTTGFRKWVTTILSTTCVAQNVVILALLFVYRLKKLNPSVRGKPGSEYRLLTVALMLGNKFLDDNTYTNKTWAEVSGINVAEVHIMEVEFLSNMKYCLFTSEQDWAQWQSLLGKFASFFDQASRPVPARSQLAPILPPASSLHLPHALPSPPVSNQASPPYHTEIGQNPIQYANGQLGPTPAPSPLGHIDIRNGQLAGAKRRLDDAVVEAPSKRLAGSYDYTSPNRYSTMPVQQNFTHSVPRLTLPSLGTSGSQAVVKNAYSQASQSQQLPPLTVPARAMAMVYPAGSSQSQAPAPTTMASAGPAQQYVQTLSQQASRHHSPQHGGSADLSPTNGMPQSATALHPTAQISPTYFLQQRASPYRPVHHVSTLLYPPPSGATQARQNNIELNQMQYQPLGKPTHHTGRLPYVGQNLWIDGSQPQEMTPVHRWPNFPQQSLAPQH
ncbi:Putative cyclin PHO80 [Septoria linicola]|uniref:Cyclin PHO80 n=1 Tax=Septoria linicola TaxID=215465 RepID=A0A9Q9AQZ0_9PEZI|nr:Putative cyclin PHO80 [Septoria linicola]